MRLDKLFAALSARSEAALLRMRLDYLSAVARLNGLSAPATSGTPTKRDYVTLLLHLVCPS